MKLKSVFISFKFIIHVILLRTFGNIYIYIYIYIYTLHLHSALAKHITDPGHGIKWDNFKIFARGKTDKQCSVKETMFIRECRPSLNGNTGTEKLSLYQLESAWAPYSLHARILSTRPLCIYLRTCYFSHSYDYVNRD